MTEESTPHETAPTTDPAAAAPEDAGPGIFDLTTSLHVLSGSVRLHSEEQEWVLSSAQVVPIPPDRHAVDALEDSVFLLTVSLDTPS